MIIAMTLNSHGFLKRTPTSAAHRKLTFPFGSALNRAAAGYSFSIGRGGIPPFRRALAWADEFFDGGVAVDKVTVDFLYYMNYNSYYEKC